MMNDELFTRLDLGEYLVKFRSFLAREKPLFLSGDSKINFEKITELAKFDLALSPAVANLSDALMRISKHGVLHISEIFEFSKIIRYFLYLKRQNFEGKLASWLAAIEIPAEIEKIKDYFDDEGAFKDAIDERFAALNVAYKIKRDEIGTTLKRLIYSKALSAYLADTQIHYVNDAEALLVRGGFNRVLKGSVVARSSGGYFYVMPDAVSALKSAQSAIF